MKWVRMSALPPKADIANYFNALADDIADFITEAPVKVGAPATAAHRNVCLRAETLKKAV